MAPDLVARISSASDSFTAAMAAGDMDRCEAILVAALSECDDAGHVEAVLFSPGIHEVVFHDSLLWPEVAEILVARAQAMGPADGARALGWLATLAGQSPVAVVSARSTARVAPPHRKGVATVVERHIDLYRAWSTDASAERRVAGPYVLASCANATEADAHALLSAATREASADALATQLVALGVVHDRLALSGGSLRNLATAKLTSESSLVRLAAAVALAFLGDALGRDGMGAVIAHVSEPTALPPQWSWRTSREKPMTSDVLALAVLPWATTDAPEFALRSLAAVHFDANAVPPGVPPEIQEAMRGLATRGARAAVGKTMLKLAFDDRGRPVPRQGIAAEELDELQRLTAETLVALRVAWPALDLRRSDDIEAFLSGSTLDFRPIAIEIDGRERRWHFARILAAVAFEGVDVDRARDAALALPPADAADVASRGSPRRVDERAVTEGERARMLDVCLSILATVRGRGFDTDPLFRAAPNDTSERAPDVGIVAIACLRAHPGVLPAAYVPLVARAIAQGWWKSALLEHVRRLPEASLREVLHAVSVTPDSFPFLALQLDEIVVRNLVSFATATWVPAEADAVIRLLASGGGDIARMLEAIELPSAPLRERAVPFVERALAVVRDVPRRSER
jgi:hypothetical protein